jgi:7-carboxy-7-deazaguanine synthase
MSRTEVRDRALAFETQLVLVTGGEPLLQAATLPLLVDLCDAGRTVLIETSGERDISNVDARVHRIVDMKAPGSGESARNRLENLACLGERDELKIVIADQADYLWARELILRERLIGRVREVLLSPVYGVLDPRALIEWTLADRLEVRVQLQLHKYIWGKDAQGV